MTLADAPLSSIGPLPRVARLEQFLALSEHDALLDWILSNEHRFVPATVIQGENGANSYDSSIRSALKLRDLGPLDPLIYRRFRDIIPQLMLRTGTKPPVPKSLEIELAAYGDGAHFLPHLDMAVGPLRKPLGARPGEDRVLSAVYYLHRAPKAFSGGALRLYRFGADPRDSAGALDFEPTDNSLVAFPSWAMHEVQIVHCPSQAFADSRFSLNCWYCRVLAAPKLIG